MPAPLKVLGIETSCDETAAAVVTETREILSNVVLSQTEIHAPFAGVVPENAARAHLDHMDGVAAAALDEAGVALDEIDAVASTCGPGLIGGVMVGAMTGKALAWAAGKPFLAVNHLEGHALTPRLANGAPFPYLLLLASGGHTQVLAVTDVGGYSRLGATIDDAIGEAFDKTARMLGLAYPGGPAVEARAQQGDPTRFALPRPMKGRPGCDFSFSGLKTKVRETIEALPEGPVSDKDTADLCASFQAAAVDAVADRVKRAVTIFSNRFGSGHTLVAAGGVAANKTLRARLEGLAGDAGMTFAAPPPALCTDNGAMIAWAGLERLKRGLTDPLDFKPRPRWPLDPDAPPAIGAGVKA